MDPISQTHSSPAIALRSVIADIDEKCPKFIRPYLGRLFPALAEYVATVELRLSQLEGAAKQAPITYPIEEVAIRAHRRAALAARSNCEDCEG